MRVFTWYSSAMANYASGHIVVAADTVEEARAAVMADIEAQFQHCKVSDYERSLIEAGDQDEIDDVEKNRQRFVKAVTEDIADEPQKVIGAGRTVFIEGGE